MLVHNFDCCISRSPGSFNCVDAARKKVKSSHARLIYIDYVSEFQSFRVPEFQSSRVSEFQSFRVSEFQSIRVSEFHNFRVSQSQSFFFVRYRNTNVLNKVYRLYFLYFYYINVNNFRHIIWFWVNVLLSHIGK